MAAVASLPVLLEELNCSICLDFFKDPVLIPNCGHNFCRDCLTRSWGASESEASCPQCRQTFAPRSLLPNRQLARVVEEARLGGGHPGEEGASFCPKHREPLKLFCREHETLICVVCDRAKEHKDHSVVPAEEAFQEYKLKVEDCLKTRKEEKEKIVTDKRDTEKKLQEMLDIIKKVKKYVVADFRELQIWLEGQEKRLLSEMEVAEKKIMARKKAGLARHKEKLCALDHLIQEIEEKHQQPASKLLQDIGSILEKYVRPLSFSSRTFLAWLRTFDWSSSTYVNPVRLLRDSEWTIWDYIDITGFLKSAMEKKRENVILDPETAHPDYLDLSEDQRSVKGLKPIGKINPVSNSKGFLKQLYVLGCQKFSSGRHFWEVIVGDEAGWGVGVARKPLNVTNIDAETNSWLIGEWEGKYMAISPSKHFDLVLKNRPKRIYVFLNCEEGLVAFLDATTTVLFHTFSDVSLVGVTLRPCFFLLEGASLTFPLKKGVLHKVLASDDL